MASLGQFMLVLLPVTDLSENKNTQEAIELSTGFSKRQRESREFSSFYSQRLRQVVFLSSPSNQYLAQCELKPADQQNPVIFSFQCACSF